MVRDAGIPSLRRPEARLVYPVPASRDEHSAAGRGDDLVAVERERPDCSERASRASLVERPQRVHRQVEEWIGHEWHETQQTRGGEHNRAETMQIGAAVGQPPAKRVPRGQRH